MLRRLLGIIGGTFNVGRAEVQPVAEVRALRTWEEADEGIIRIIGVAFRAAQAGEFSWCVFTSLAGYDVELSWVRNIGGASFHIMIGVAPLDAVISVRTSPPADRFWGGGSAALYSDQEGDSVGPMTGVIVGRMAAGTERRNVYVLRAGSTDNVGFVGIAVNTAVDLDFEVRMIPVK